METITNSSHLTLSGVNHRFIPIIKKLAERESTASQRQVLPRESLPDRL